MKLRSFIPRFDRKRWLRRLDYGHRFRVRFLARTSACLFFAAAISHGLIAGGYLDYPDSPWLKLPGRAASLFGFAADDIHITGLVHQDPESVLSAIGVQPASSLVGFDAGRARALLENLDWVASARVAREFPNQLDIVLEERKPFAIWQRDGAQYVIDKTGAAMSTLNPHRLSSLLVVTGEGANEAAIDLVNQLEAQPALRSRVIAAARVGFRRWTLFLDNGLSVALPEQDAEKALQRLADLDRQRALLSKGIQSVDLRLADRVIIAVAEIKSDAGKKPDKLKISQR
ncbi:hypothetical protein BH10PSE7_BH10PSE7_40790 [soil metagenome]